MGGEDDKVTRPVRAALHGGGSYKKHVKDLVACWLVNDDLFGHMSGEL